MAKKRKYSIVTFLVVFACNISYKQLCKRLFTSKWHSPTAYILNHKCQDWQKTSRLEELGSSI